MCCDSDSLRKLHLLPLIVELPCSFCDCAVLVGNLGRLGKNILDGGIVVVGIIGPVSAPRNCQYSEAGCGDARSSYAAVFDILVGLFRFVLVVLEICGFCES